MIASAPVGAVKVLVDGTTTARAGEWPHLEYDVVTLPGRNNTVGQPIYLLPIDVPNGLAVSETVGGTLTIPSVPGFSLTMEPDAATFPGGSKSGVISATVVHADKVPMTPNFGQQPRLVLTIQPSGVRFDPPARITYPNLDGLAPGAITELYSFDHDLGEFVGIGTGSVSSDGLIVESDPGVGIIKGGWHCEGNPAPTGECENVNVTIVTPRNIVIEQGGSRDVTAKGGPEDMMYTWSVSGEGFSIQGDSTATDLKQITVVREVAAAPLNVAPSSIAKQQTENPLVSVTVTKHDRSDGDSKPIADLKIEMPNRVVKEQTGTSDVLFIEEEDSTKMPNIEMDAVLSGVTPDLLANRLFTWTLKELTLKSGECGSTSVSGSGPLETISSREFPKAIPSPGDANETFRPETLFGGVMELEVMTVIDGCILKDKTPLLIGGRNPNTVAIAGQIGDNILQNLSCRESNMRQFVPDELGGPVPGCPLFNRKADGSTDGGVGLFQLTPPPSTKEMWDWKANVQAGKDLFLSKRAIARETPDRLIQNAPAFVTFVNDFNDTRELQGKAPVDIRIPALDGEDQNALPTDPLTQFEREWVRANHGYPSGNGASGLQPQFGTRWFEHWLAHSGDPNVPDVVIVDEGDSELGTRGSAEFVWEQIPDSDRPAVGDPQYVENVLNQLLPCR